MNRQCYFTEKDIEPVVYRRKLLKYDIEVERRNAENYKIWKRRYSEYFLNKFELISGSLK